jgi:hypothetical protein
MFAATPTNHAKGSYIELGPVAASNGLDFLVAWSHQTRAADEWVGELLAQRIGRDGTPRDGSGIDVSRSPLRSDARAIAFGASVYLVVWCDNEKLLGTFILPSGQLLPTFTIRIAPFLDDTAAVVWDGQQFLVVWSEEWRIRGAFVSLDGTVSESRQLSSNPAPDDSRPQKFPSIAWNGDHFLLGWSALIFGSVIMLPAFPPTDDSYVRLLAANGTPAGDSLRLPNETRRLYIASNNVDFYVVMQNPGRVTAIGVRNQGNELTTDPAVVTIFDGDTVGANVTFDGADYVIALRYGVLNFGWLATKRVRTTGTPYRQRVTAIDRIENFEDPAIASNAAGEILLATSFTRPSVEFPHVYRYLESQLEEMPAPPPAPTKLIALRFADGKAIVSWTGAPDDRGYFIEIRYAHDTTYSFQTLVPGNVRSAALNTAAESVRVRAFGAGGLSEPSVAVAVQNVGRRRSVGR